MSLTLEQKQEQVTKTLSDLRDPQERLAWLIEQARKRPILDATLRVEANRIEGCLARLWLSAQFRQGRCHYQSESDSLIVKAVAGLLCEFYSGHTPVEILAYPADFLGELKLIQHLTVNRRNGLGRLVERIRKFAATHASDPAIVQPGPARA